MFTASEAVFECQEPVAALVQRWHRLMETTAWQRFLHGPHQYQGVVSEQGFHLTLYPRAPGFPIVCRGRFEPSEQGTRIRVQFLPAITLGRMAVLAGACVALAVSAFVLWSFWEFGVPRNRDPLGLLVAIGTLAWHFAKIAWGRRLCRCLYTIGRE